MTSIANLLADAEDRACDSQDRIRALEDALRGVGHGPAVDACWCAFGYPLDGVHDAPCQTVRGLLKVTGGPFPCGCDTSIPDECSAAAELRTALVAATFAASFPGGTPEEVRTEDEAIVAARVALARHFGH